jgi:hypothetical protein
MKIRKLLAVALAAALVMTLAPPAFRSQVNLLRWTWTAIT